MRVVKALARVALTGALGFGLAGCGGHDLPVNPYLQLVPVSPSGQILGPPSGSQLQYKAVLMLWFHQTDANHDGVLTRDEVIADADRSFDLFDLDHDGSITSAELEKYRLTQPFRAQPHPVTPLLGAQERAVQPDSVEALPDGASYQGSRVRLQVGLDPVMSADTDSDFRVTREELRAQSLRKFDKWDADHDGKVTADEFLAAMMAPFEALTKSSGWF
ncbi:MULTISPECIES: EF-hand domain-containing protein [Nitrospirillum]|uniref:EF hand domain-containing protein n=1 Tax=Nitrospirillum amazonense TaxID=28077 RepID=A0A560FRR6_9PROT|nr:EF-hand domain-containing protein [Nitrospirillum amazonense]MEC4593711.1 EF-hand domain-containing protein [Nitrospirillum amazonense]TWB24326.1 EF hand domain-containing protein [Nitrospirillum amazonense]